MRTSASTKAITAKRFYPLRTWRDASEGFPMIDVYRWWAPKLGAMFGNVDLLTLWHSLAFPSTDVLQLWRTESLHAQAIDVLGNWDQLRDPPDGVTYRRESPITEWLGGATQDFVRPLDQWSGARDRSHEVGRWGWASESPRPR